MQIVIDIDDNLYTRLFDNGVDNYDDAVDMAKSIRKGTPLPKGHGRLGDLDAVMNDICNSINEMTKIGLAVDGEYLWGKLNDAIENAPTIIEADTESDNEDIPMEYFESGGC